MFDYLKEYPAALQELSKWLAEGHIKSRNTIIPGGLKAAPEALVSLFKGANTGTYKRTDSLTANVPLLTAMGFSTETGKMMVEINSPGEYEESQGKAEKNLL